LRIGEPAADLAAAAALVSSLSGLSLAADSVFFGEIALSGAIRPVAHGLARLKEAAKLGFCRATIPQGPPENGDPTRDLTVRSCAHISSLVAGIAAPDGLPEKAAMPAKRS
jgi:DNA repair protein RadA/Sms